MTRLTKIKQIAQAAFVSYSVRPAKISFRFLRGNGGVVAGKTHFVGGKSPVIYLDILCFIFFSFDDVTEVVLHEVSHVIHFYKYPERRNINHGTEWKKIAISLGIKPECVTKIKKPKKIFKIIWSCQKLFVRLHQIKNIKNYGSKQG